MDFKVNYTIVGLFLVILVALLIAIIFWLTGSSNREYNSYLVFMNEPVSGLSEEAPVRFNGVEVGYVKNIELNPSNPQQVELILNIEKNIPINQSTTATLMMQGITGITYIGLRASAVQAPPIPILPGNKYPIIQSTPSLLVEMSKAVHEVAVSIKGATSTLNNLFDHQNQTAIQTILQNLKKFSQTLANNNSQIEASLKATRKLLQNSAQASQQLPATTRTVSQQLVPDMLQSINRLNQILNNLEKFTQNLQNNPAILIRGTQPQTLGPGEH